MSKLQVFEIVYCSPTQIHPFVIFVQTKYNERIKNLHTCRSYHYLNLGFSWNFSKLNNVNLNFLKKRATWSSGSKTPHSERRECVFLAVSTNLHSKSQMFSSVRAAMFGLFVVWVGHTKSGGIGTWLSSCITALVFSNMVWLICSLNLYFWPRFSCYLNWNLKVWISEA